MHQPLLSRDKGLRDGGGQKRPDFNLMGNNAPAH